jgi:hypothetical protein
VNHAYTAQLTVTDNQGASASATVNIQVNAIPPITPAAPGNLTATALSKSQIALKWTGYSGNETGFKIARRTGATCTNFSQIVNVGTNVTSYSNTGLKRHTTHRYRVRAYNGAGNSAYSAIANAATPK